ncbi:MAG TPA: TlpA disulfide reductase family protein [Chthonomonadaceae bacterium]|nr:TlpA disulfide reductase family protein [Chthonomonadaceae bacterium]
MKILVALALLTGAAAQADTIHLKLLPSGAAPMYAWRTPQRLVLTINPPQTVKKVPAGLVAPRYGLLPLGPKERQTIATVILDEGVKGKSRLYVDANADGDLTNDPAPEWKAHPYQGKSGQTFTAWEGYITVPVFFGETPQPLRLGVFRADKDDTEQAQNQDALLYYADYGCVGKITLGGATYDVGLVDLVTTGDFRGWQGYRAGGVLLQIDVNGNGVFERRGEAFNVLHPFNIRGTTYEIADMGASGETFTLRKSDKSVPEIPPPPDLRPGRKALPFTARTTSGKTIRFPDAYKGKIVLLYFWVTWGDSLQAGLPYLAEAYRRYHAQGFEALGVSLDKEDAAAKLADFTRANKLPWPQIYDGKGWQAEIAQLYGVTGLPTAYLIDGSSGEVLASGSDVAGPSLSKTLQKALARKRGA